MHPEIGSSPHPQGGNLLSRYAGVFRYSGRAVSLVWATRPTLAVSLAFLTLTAGLLPAAVAFVGKLIVDAVLLAAQTGLEDDRWRAIRYVLMEGGLVAVMAGAQRGINMCESLLRALLGQRVNEMILEKAVTLQLRDFENSETYDQMTRARREASSRP